MPTSVSNPKKAKPRIIRTHHLLLFSTFSLLMFGLVMMASASITFAGSSGISPFFRNQMIFVLLGLGLCFVTTKVAMRWVLSEEVMIPMLIMTILLLVVTLFMPEVNGSSRWINTPLFNIQTSEIAKLVVIIFTAEYVVRRSREVKESFSGFLRLSVILFIVVFFIMSQPDMGASVVVAGSAMTLFVLAGAPLLQVVVLGALAVVALFAAIIRSPYRSERLTSFANPWDDPFGTDYQLSRSLIAFGRGELTGVGYGQSIQKLEHLPEAHTDFILAIIGEELGFIGVLTVLLLYALLIGSMFRIVYKALMNKHAQMGYLACGIAVIFAMHVFINAGMNLGLLPTKGLTLPLISYGGSSMLISLIMIGMLLRINRETEEHPASFHRYASRK